MIGWIGSALFAICAVPQALACYRQGHARGVDSIFLWCWLGGEVLTLIYVCGFAVPEWPLIFNYGFNLASLLIIFRYKYWEAK